MIGSKHYSHSHSGNKTQMSKTKQNESLTGYETPIASLIREFVFSQSLKRKKK